MTVTLDRVTIDLTPALAASKIIAASSATLL